MVTFICDGVSRPDEHAQCVERAAAVLRDRTEQIPKISLWSALWPVGWVVYYVIGLWVGICIYRDARRRDWIFLGVHPFWWMVIAIFDPAMGMLAYWALHYSKLAQSYHEATVSTSSEPPPAPSPS